MGSVPAYEQSVCVRAGILPGADAPKVPQSQVNGFARSGEAIFPMGLDVGNDFGQFHVNWPGTRWFSVWCKDHELPYPFIGWVSGDNSGDQCVLGPDNEHTRRAREWCGALEEKQPEIAKLGNKLLAMHDLDLYGYLYPHGRLAGARALSNKEWERRAVAAWYAILKHGVEHGDTLEYW